MLCASSLSCICVQTRDRPHTCVPCPSCYNPKLPKQVALTALPDCNCPNPTATVWAETEASTALAWPQLPKLQLSDPPTTQQGGVVAKCHPRSQLSPTDLKPTATTELQLYNLNLYISDCQCLNRDKLWLQSGITVIRACPNQESEDSVHHMRERLARCPKSVNARSSSFFW